MKPATLTNAQKATIQITESGVTFLNKAADVGFQDLGLSVQVQGVVHMVQYSAVKKTASSLVAEGRVGTSPLTVRTEVRKAGKANAIVVQHTLINPSARELPIGEVCTCQTSQATVRLAKLFMYDGRFCHTDNCRTEQYPYFQPEYPYCRPLPITPVALGRSEDQPVPALYVTNAQYTHGLVIAASSQNNSLPAFRISRAPGNLQDGLFRQFEMWHEFPQASYMCVPAGGKLKLDGVWLQIAANVHPQDAWCEYIDYVSAHNDLLGPKTPLLDTAFYCSWNYERLSKQEEGELIKTAKFMAKNLPNIQYFLMDAGYQKKCESGLHHGHMEGFYPEPRQNWNANTFPKGIRHWSDGIRKAGLRPGIWWSPMVPTDSELAADHPDWVLRDEHGEPVLIGKSYYLDLSVSPALAFVDKVLSVVLGEWKMDAIKMDFWSQGFEARSGRLAAGNTTAIDTRNKLFGIIRKYLPKNGGIFMTCVAVGSGNPFIGQWADTYRNTHDIGNGGWSHQVTACEWSLPTHAIEGRKTYLLNTDGIGICREAPENENFFRLTYGYITMGMLEIDGYLYLYDDKYIQALRKLSDRCDRGYRCLCPDEQAWTGRPLPEVLYVDFPADSPTRKHHGVKQSLAFLNWTDEPKAIVVSRAKIGQKGKALAENFWTGEQETFEGDFIVKEVPARSSLLYDIRS